MKLMHLKKAIVATVVLAAAAFTTQSFTKTETVTSDTVFYYDSPDTSPGAFADVNNWSTTGSSSCIAKGNRPCQILVPEGTTLDDQIGGMTNEQVLALHPNERKP